MTVPELDELAELLPQRDAKGRFFWQDYVDRVADCFDGLPAPDDAESFVQGCLAAGCKAVPAMERSTLWQRQAPPPSDPRARTVFELRVRLGLFFAASLRYLTHGACRLRVQAGNEVWHPFRGERLAYKAFVAAWGRDPDVTWSQAVPDHGQVCVLAQYFLQFREVTLLSFDLAQDVYNHLRTDDPTGLFSILLSDDGQVEEGTVDVAGVFLAALAQAVERKALRLNTRVGGHVFVTPAFWLLTTPVGLDHVTGLLRKCPGRRRHDFTRLDVFDALHSQGCLAGADDRGDGKAARVCVVDSESWLVPLKLKGLPILPGSLPGHATAPLFDGAIILKEETDIGQHGLTRLAVPCTARRPDTKAAAGCSTCGANVTWRAAF